MFPSNNIPSSIFSSHGRNSPTVRWCHGVELWINSHHVTRRVKLELSFRPILLDVSQRIPFFFQVMHLYLYPPYAFLEFVFTIQCIYLLYLFTFHIALLYSLIAFYKMLKNLMSKDCKMTSINCQTGTRDPSCVSMQINVSFLGCIVDRRRTIMFSINLTKSFSAV